MRKIKSKWIKLSVSGMNIEKTINSLTSQNIEFINIVKKDYHSCDFEVKKKYVKLVVKCFEDRNVKILSEQHFGVNLFLKTIKDRCGILIGLALSFVALFLVSNCVFKIEVCGIEKMQEEKIVECLKENGVKTNSFFDKSNENIEKILSSNFEEISLVSVIRKGNSLIINIKEKLLNDEYENKDNFLPLCASYDGMITKINHIQGTLKVKVGDIVQVGDILVEANMTDSKGNVMPVIPKAEIFAEVYENGVSTHYDIQTTVVRTGNVVKNRILEVCGINLFGQEKDSPFSNFEKEERVVKLSENNLLPLVFRDIFYYEITAVVTEVDFDSVKDQKLAEAKNLAYQKVQNENVIKEYEVISHIVGKTEVKYIIVVEKLISGENEDIL